MGSITTGVGLLSGIDTASLIDQLIALESRSKIAVQRRIATLQSQQTALLDINARLLGLKSAARSFRADSIFQSAIATSSNENVLTASAGTKAQPGTFSFVVKQLVANSQKLSRGFIDADTTPAGISSLTFALGRGGVDRDRDLAELNGGQGVRAGKIVITDRIGSQAQIDLTDAITLNEVLARINGSTDIAVEATVQDDALVITDISGGGGTLTVANATGSHTATDLGIVGSSAGGTITGSNINLVGGETALSWLNDGTGVLLRDNNPDLRITDRNGTVHNIDLGRINSDIDGSTLLAELNNGEGVTLSGDHDNPDIKFVARDGTEYEVNLTGVTTVQGLINRVSSETGGHIQLAITDGKRLTVTDTVGGSGNLRVLGAGENGDSTAGDLGILNEDGVAADSFNGELIPNTLMQPQAHTLGEVINRINEQTNGAISASIDASTGGVKLVDNTGGGGNLIVRTTAANPYAADHLGIKTDADGIAGSELTGKRLIAGLGSVLVRNLNGGEGLGGATTLEITDRSGVNITVTGLGGYHSLSQIVDAINQEASEGGAQIVAKLNDSGTGLIIVDESGGTAGNLIIGGDAAAALGIEANVADTTVRGSNLRHQYITEASKLSDLNYGRGVGSGSFRITDGFGKTATINIGSNQKSLYDVIQAINAQSGANGLAINARINDTGDGLLIEENLEWTNGATPFVAMRVEALNGSAAKDLNIIGQSKSVSGAFIDGGYTRTIEFKETDTLNDIVSKINASGVPISASVLNTGSGANPFRINFTSNVSGRVGELIIDGGDFDLGLSTLTKGQDAKVYFGGGSSGEGFLVTSRTNTINGVLPDVSINLHAVSDDPVNVTVSRDDQKIIGAIEKFVNAFNDAIARIDEYDFFDVDSEKRGVLLGNPTTSRVRAALHRAVQQRAEGVDTQFQFLREVGIRIGSGGKLTFDQEKFMQAWESDPAAVENLFAAYESTPKPPEEILPGITVQSSGNNILVRGIGDLFNDLLDDMTDSVNGTMTLADRNFKTLIDASRDRMAILEQRLERRREQLERQFAAMETSLAQLQGQSNALMQLSNNASMMMRQMGSPR